MKKLFSLFMVLSLFSCGFFQPPLPETEFTRPLRMTDPIRLKVKTIEIVSEFSPSFTRPNIEHLLPTSIERNARTWARENLEAVEPHSTRIASFIIKDASMTEHYEKSDSLLRRSQDVYKANLNIVLRIQDTEKLSSAETQINAWKELSIPADSSLEQKEAYWNKMIKDLFQNFDVAMQKSIEQNLSQYVADNTHIQRY